MYFQLPEKRWALCPRSQDGVDFLKDGNRGNVAHQGNSSGVWNEYCHCQNAWASVELVLESAVLPAVAAPAHHTTSSACPGAGATESRTNGRSDVKRKQNRMVVARCESTQV